MPKYRKKPVVVEAERYKPGVEDGYKVFVGSSPENALFVAKEDLEKIKGDIRIACPAIKTLEGWMEISEDDYIVTGIKGERYPVKPDIFEATYEPAEEAQQTARERVRELEKQAALLQCVFDAAKRVVDIYKRGSLEQDLLRVPGDQIIDFIYALDGLESAVYMYLDLAEPEEEKNEVRRLSEYA